MSLTTTSRITGVDPLWAVEGGRVTILGEGFALDPELPEVRLGGIPARLSHAARRSLTVSVPSGLDGGRTPVRVSTAPGETAYVEIGAPIATGLHQVDSPVYDRDGNLYVTFSGARGQESPVSIYVVRPDGSREPFVSGLANPTSMTMDPEGRLHVSSRFDGSVHRVGRDGAVTTVATDLGVACGIAFGPDGNLYVGDRTGSILRVEGGRAVQIATLPASVAAFHLAFGPEGYLYVSAPTLAPLDVVYRIAPDGEVEVCCSGFGRPQGLAFDSTGMLYVVDALAGDSALYRLRPGQGPPPQRLLWGGSLIGLAFDPHGAVALASSETVYRLDADLTPLFE